MNKIKSFFGYTWAIAGLLIMIALPFRLMSDFSNAVAATKVRPHPIFSGGAVHHTIERGAYRIEVHVPVRADYSFQSIDPFVQLAWTPTAGLPDKVSDEVDIDGDGQVDAVVTFDVPRDPGTSLVMDVTSRDPRVIPVQGASRTFSTSMIVRLQDRIVARIALRQ